MKRNQNRKLFKKKSRSNYKLGCIITIVILIPVLYGVYLYCQQFNTQTQKSNEPQVNTSSQIPSGRNLEIPVSLAPKQEQIIRHTGYTVSYNKDLKLLPLLLKLIFVFLIHLHYIKFNYFLRSLIWPEDMPPISLRLLLVYVVFIVMISIILMVKH